MPARSSTLVSFPPAANCALSVGVALKTVHLCWEVSLSVEYHCIDIFTQMLIHGQHHHESDHYAHPSLQRSLGLWQKSFSFVYILGNIMSIKPLMFLLLTSLLWARFSILKRSHSTRLIASIASALSVLAAVSSSSFFNLSGCSLILSNTS